jgi:hypothetical protein
MQISRMGVSLMIRSLKRNSTRDLREGRTVFRGVRLAKFPLPAGEGWGEGENKQSFKSRVYTVRAEKQP